jgi:ABC-type transporter MlaC component
MSTNTSVQRGHPPDLGVKLHFLYSAFLSCKLWSTSKPAVAQRFRAYFRECCGQLYKNTFLNFLGTDCQKKPKQPFPSILERMNY